MRLPVLALIGLLCWDSSARAPESDQTRAMLRHFEGFAPEPYIDGGACYAGYGHRLEPIDREQAERWLEADLYRVVLILDQNLPWFAELDAPRRSAVIQIGYQVGPYGLLEFSAMLEALKAGDYERAAAEALESRWARQTPERARAVVGMLR